MNDSKSLISISHLGSISVLGVPICCSTECAKKRLSEYGVQENGRSLYIENYKSNDSLPKLNFSFLKSSNGNWIEKIQIHSHPTKKSCEDLCEYFKSIFNKDFCPIEARNGNVVTLDWKTRLCSAGLFKQYGAGELAPNACPVGLYISPSLLNDNDKEMQTQLIRRLYLEQDDVVNLNNECQMKLNLRPVIKYLFAFILLIIICSLLYLRALNGRYANIGDGCMFDKWTCKYIEPNF